MAASETTNTRKPNVPLRIFNAVWMFFAVAGTAVLVAAGQRWGVTGYGSEAWEQIDQMHALGYAAYGAAALFALLAVVVAKSQPSEG